MSERTRTRSIQRPGFSRLRTIGRRSDVFGDFYHFVLSLRWWQFLSLASTVFIAVNALFAGLYLVEPGSITAPADDDFASSFFFSVQTMATIGYGGMAPATRFADVLVTIEAALGMMFTALITGLTFARFARPTARVLFSNRMIIGPRDGVPFLMVRMANWRHNIVSEARLELFVLIAETTLEGEFLRRPVRLPLERGQTAFFWMSWMAMHKIDEHSPFYGPGAIERLRAADARIWLSLNGVDQTLAQPIHATCSYSLDDIVVGVRFVDVIRTGDGEIEIDYRNFHEVEPIDPRFRTPEIDALAAALGGDGARSIPRA